MIKNNQYIIVRLYVLSSLKQSLHLTRIKIPLVCLCQLIMTSSENLESIY